MNADQHGVRFCPPCIHEEQIRDIKEESASVYSAVFVNGNVRGSLMTRTARNEEDIQRILDNVAALPKTILTYLLIAGALLVVLQFLGPSIRKAMGMAFSVSPQVVASQSQNAGSTESIHF